LARSSGVFAEATKSVVTARGTSGTYRRTLTRAVRGPARSADRASARRRPPTASPPTAATPADPSRTPGIFADPDPGPVPVAIPAAGVPAFAVPLPALTVP